MAENTQTELKTGTTAADGSVYVGVSPTTGQPLYAAAEDETGFMTWRKAKKTASQKTDHGHDDWRLPTAAELSLMVDNRKEGALADTFNVHGSGQEAFYWSGTPHSLRYAKAHCSYKGIFKSSIGIKKDGHLNVRCVRNG